MKVLMLGNGFDLHHNFPTTYSNFLNTIKFLLDSHKRKGSISPETYKNVGDILGDASLHLHDPFIRQCYNTHKVYYDATNVAFDDILFFIEKAKDNPWFNYFCKFIDNSKGWIDFEKEIARVLEAFSYFFNSVGNRIFDDENEILNSFIVAQFAFFSDIDAEAYYNECFLSVSDVKKEYRQEMIPGSELEELNKPKIVDELYAYLCDLSEMLKLYLRVFVENPIKKMLEYKRKPLDKDNLFNSVQKILTFNYTYTFEFLYGGNCFIEHVHGGTSENIVLGINPDNNDELEELNTLFVNFKKYFQRIIEGYDSDFFATISQLKTDAKYDNGIILNVLGHSLDVTDEDVIKKLVSLSKKINIYYHKKEKIKSYVNNLVTIYGKTEYDKLRESKKIQFIQQTPIEWLLENYEEKGEE